MYSLFFSVSLGTKFKHDLSFKISSKAFSPKVSTIDLELITAENVNTMLELYKEEQTAVMEFNDALLEYYREILQ